MAKRLTAEQWVDAGLRALAREGFLALKADLLAKALGVSRGSFYWHFADLEAYHQAVIERWQVRATEWIMADIDRLLPAQRLPALLFRAFHTEVSLEMAVRAWAVSSPAVRRAVEQVDAMRLDYTGDLLSAEGAPSAMAKARMIYWTYLGFVLIGGGEKQAGPVLDELLSCARVRPN